MDEVGAVGLEVDAFARGVGADEDAQRLHVRIGVEGALDLLAAIRSGRAREDADAIVGAIGSASASRSRRSSQRRVSSYSVKMISRRSFHVGPQAGSL